jgi:hypothetical protein
MMKIALSLLSIKELPMICLHYARNWVLALALCIGSVAAGQAGTVAPWHSSDFGQPSALFAAAEVPEQKLNIGSTYGALLDNPVTKAVLLKLAAEVVNNPQSQMGRDLAFKDLAQYEPTLTPDKLRQIEAALAKAQEK